jgi:DNA-binding FrmR family transcriptional regulator
MNFPAGTAPPTHLTPEIPRMPHPPLSATTEPTDAAMSPADGCGCGPDETSRKALAVDLDIKERNLKRLRRIEGQIRGLQKMVEDDRYCADILTQISSAHEALRAVGRELMRNHLKHCAASAIAAGGAERDAMFDELVDMMYKHSR